jgi:CHAD domain-containing protein
VLQLIGDSALVPLFDIQQTRVFRRMSQGELLIAEMSLDNVHVVVGEKRKSHFELEIELAPQGTTRDMGAIVAYLQDEWDLKPESRAKFERALAILDTDLSQGNLLTPQERAICVQIAKRSDLYGRRAQGLLLLDDGISQEEVARRADRTARTVRRWQRTFRDERLGTFPNRILTDIYDTSAVILPQMPSEEEQPSEEEATSEPQPEPQPLKALFKRYIVDRAHAQAVADHALTLFDKFGPLHGLPPERRPLLETAALVHNIGLAADAAGHHKVGRDILLTHPPKELGEEERLMAAMTTYLHRKQMTPKKLDKKTSKAPFSTLPKSARDEALALSALIRIADGLDYSQTQSSEMGEIMRREHGVDIEVTGPYAAIDAARAQEKSDLWQLLFKTELRFHPAHLTGDLIPYPEEDLAAEMVVDLTPETLPDRPNVTAEDTMAEAARKTLLFHFQHMLYNEPGTREGKDIEALHDMRVATRRMRAAFRVFDDYLDSKRLKSIRKGAKRTCGKLGTVRDLDVFWAKTERYLEGLPAERQDDLESLKETWKAEHEESREALLAYLDSNRYMKFKEEAAELLQTPEVWRLPALTKKGEAVPHRVQHVVPMEVYERMACVLAYDEWVTNSEVSLKRLHRLRIAGKRLRYTLEFFEEVLAPQASDLIQQMKVLQDHLGDLQDAVVASELLRDFLTWGTWGVPKGKKKSKLPKEPVVAPGVAIYMADKQAELQRLLDTFPDMWAYFQSQEFKQTVAVVVAPL